MNQSNQTGAVDECQEILEQQILKCGDSNGITIVSTSTGYCRGHVFMNDMAPYPTFQDGNWAKAIHCYFKQLQNCTILDGTITIPRIKKYTQNTDKLIIDPDHKCEKYLLKEQIKILNKSFIWPDEIENILRKIPKKSRKYYEKEWQHHKQFKFTKNLIEVTGSIELSDSDFQPGGSDPELYDNDDDELNLSFKENRKY